MAALTAVPTANLISTLSEAREQLKNAILTHTFPINPDRLEEIRELATRQINSADTGDEALQLKNISSAVFRSSFHYEMAASRLQKQEEIDGLREEVDGLREELEELNNTSVPAICCNRTARTCTAAFRAIGSACLWTVKTAVKAAVLTGIAIGSVQVYNNLALLSDA